MFKVSRKCAPRPSPLKPPAAAACARRAALDPSGRRSRTFCRSPLSAPNTFLLIERILNRLDGESEQMMLHHGPPLRVAASTHVAGGRAADPVAQVMCSCEERADKRDIVEGFL